MTSHRIASPAVHPQGKQPGGAHNEVQSGRDAAMM